MVDLSRLLSENLEFAASRIRNAHHRSTEINELFLRRVSAELHDGPAQLLGFGLLRLDALRPLKQEPSWLDRRTEPCEAPDEFETVRSALADALNEIRVISAGLAPPELIDLSLSEALEMAASRHARRTGTTVGSDIGGLPDCVDASLKVCLYCFAQEGLNNAFRHASGRGQALSARCDGDLFGGSGDR